MGEIKQLMPGPVQDLLKELLDVMHEKHTVHNLTTSDCLSVLAIAGVFLVYTCPEEKQAKAYNHFQETIQLNYLNVVAKPKGKG